MITTVGSSAATGTDAAQAAMKQSTGMNKNDFLKLFVTQLQNQDPLNPQDGTEFISQLAQLTQVEQSYNTNTNLQNILSQGGDSAALSAVTLIGKQVESPAALVSLDQGQAATINFKLAQVADQVTVSVLNERGEAIRTLEAGAKGSGTASVAWDGRDSQGKEAAAGAYSFTVTAKTANGSTVASTPIFRGTVSAVDLSGTVPVLSVGKVKLSLADVSSVSQGG
jgi:flagellar basal-body rod modification protein FlgD